MCFGWLQGIWQWSKMFQNTNVSSTATSMTPSKHDWPPGWCEDWHAFASLIQGLQSMTYLFFAISTTFSWQNIPRPSLHPKKSAFCRAVDWLGFWRENSLQANFHIRPVLVNFVDSGRQSPKSKKTNDKSQNGKVESNRVWLACPGDLVCFGRDFNLCNYISSRLQTLNLKK